MDEEIRPDTTACIAHATVEKSLTVVCENDWAYPSI